MPITAGIYYASSGGGQADCPPVVLIHGAGATHLVWPVELRRLPGFRVIALDLVGHGKSTGVAQNSVTAYSNAVMNFLASMGIYGAVLVGHSLGGAIALQAAIEQPERVKALGLISSAAVFPITSEIASRITNPVLRPDALTWIEQHLFGPNIPPERADRVIKTLHKVRPSLLASDWQACISFDARDALDKVLAPTWLAVGSNDQIIPAERVQSTAARIKNARAQVFDRAGHMLILEEPRALASGLMRFLRQNFGE
jgi:pimeloyl-ACP methyl ester carboxylesterase